MLVARDVRYIYVTTTRALPCSLDEHLRVDRRARFHVYVDPRSGETTRVRQPDEVVVADGLLWTPLALEIEVVCVAGWYVSMRAEQPGAGPLEPKAAAHLAEILRSECESFDLPVAALTGAWEHGAPAYCGEPIEDVVRAVRGDPAPYRAPNWCMALGEDLSHDRVREVLRASLEKRGILMPEAGTGPWTVADQRALLAFQAAVGLETTGIVDPFTRGALRAELGGRQPRFGPLPPADDGPRGGRADSLQDAMGQIIAGMRSG